MGALLSKLIQGNGVNELIEAGDKAAQAYPWKTTYKGFPRPNDSTFTSWTVKQAQELELENAALSGKASVLSALSRTDSRGSHLREDYHSEERDWLKSMFARMADGDPKISRVVPVDEYSDYR